MITLRNAPDVLRALSPLVDEMGKHQDKVRPYMNHNLRELSDLAQQAESLTIGFIGTLAAQVAGEINTVDNPDGSITVSRGGHELGTITAQVDAGRGLDSFNIGANVKLTDIGVAIFELDCPSHAAEAKAKLASLGVQLIECAPINQTKQPSINPQEMN